MLNANPGLRDICHSITGGALAAQGIINDHQISLKSSNNLVGYWMPFEAAKAIAATFCWRIRYALTPIFGVEFLSLCIPPDDSSFGRMVIDPSIVRAAAISANQYRLLEGKLSAKAVGALPSPHCPPALRNERWNKRELRPKHTPRRDETETCYGTDTETSDKCSPSPSFSTTHENSWASANNSQAERMALPSPREILASLASLRNETTRPRHDAKRYFFSEAAQDFAEAKRPIIDSDGDIDDDESLADADSEGTQSPRTKTLSPLPLTNDARAAYMLMRLHMQDVMGEDEPNRKRRRAST